MLIVFEGPDGVGKTTQAKLLHDYMKRNYIDSVLTQEPAGTVLGDAIKKFTADKSYDSLTCLFLYFAARSDHVEKVINPALDQGSIVICDRFTDSTIAYQYYGEQLNEALTHAMNNVSAREIEPDITFLLTGKYKKTSDDHERYNDEAFQARVRDGYQRILEDKLKRMDSISEIFEIDTDANDIDAVHELVIYHLKDLGVLS